MPDSDHLENKYIHWYAKEGRTAKECMKKAFKKAKKKYSKKKHSMTQVWLIAGKNGGRIRINQYARFRDLWSAADSGR